MLRCVAYLMVNRQTQWLICYIIYYYNIDHIKLVLKKDFNIIQAWSISNV